MRDQFLPCFDRGVNGVVGQIQKEGLVSIRLDEVERLLGKIVGEVVAILGAGHVDSRVRLEHALMRHPVSSRVVQFESAVFRRVAAPAEVPLADGGRGITGLFERLGDDRFAGRKSEREVRLK